MTETGAYEFAAAAFDAFSAAALRAGSYSCAQCRRPLLWDIAPQYCSLECFLKAEDDPEDSTLCAEGGER